MEHRHQQCHVHHAQTSASAGKWWSRLSLRLVSVIISVAVVGYSAFYYTRYTIGPLIMMGPPALVAILWSCIDCACLWFRRGRLGVDPIACLIVDLLLFLSLGAMSGVFVVMVATFKDSGYHFAFLDKRGGEEYLRIILGFGIMATLAHLAILIVAFCEMRKRGSREPQQVMYVQGNGNEPPYFAAPAPAPAGSRGPPPAYNSVPMNQVDGMHAQDQIHAEAQELPTAESHEMLGKRTIIDV
ncbi:hypothetical protein C2857_005788 [Epichloe festucae Fl1]|uniref:Uncharacterized protein n=1 Tax=Epichloe festucae (strain Fl1) TaxID=877507 RepID=A0A7S9KT26_EPIFF|nr:hypothetical protein C2857_005788 [Epichloe festucae Fl1]